MRPYCLRLPPSFSPPECPHELQITSFFHGELRPWVLPPQPGPTASTAAITLKPPSHCPYGQAGLPLPSLFSFKPARVGEDRERYRRSMLKILTPRCLKARGGGGGGLALNLCWNPTAAAQSGKKRGRDTGNKRTKKEMRLVEPWNQSRAEWAWRFFPCTAREKLLPNII